MRAQRWQEITTIGRGLGACVLGLSLSAGAADAAPRVPASSTRAHVPIRVHVQAATLPHLYWHFLMYQKHLDHAAAEHAKKGKDGSWLSEHFQKELHFTDEQMAAVRGSSQHLDQALRGLGEQMRTVLTTDRALYAQHLISAGTPPPGRPQLLALKNQRETLIGDEVVRLNEALGADAAGRLKNFLEKDFARSVNVYDVRTAPRRDLHPTRRANSEGQ